MGTYIQEKTHVSPSKLQATHYIPPCPDKGLVATIVLQTESPNQKPRLFSPGMQPGNLHPKDDPGMCQGSSKKTPYNGDEVIPPLTVGILVMGTYIYIYEYKYKT